MTLAIAGDRARVDRVDAIAGGEQGRDPWPSVGLDPYHDLVGLCGMPGEQLVQSSHAADAFRQLPGGEPITRLVHQVHIVVCFGPVITHIQNHSCSLPPSLRLLRCDALGWSRHGLMEQCSLARHPMSAANHPGSPAGARSTLRDPTASRPSQSSPAGGSGTVSQNRSG